VDLATGEIRKAGMRQKLAGQSFLVLQALLERPQEVVTRDELRARLWPDNTFVDYELGLKKAINRLRDVLGDSAENPRFIETLPRRGYRFIAPITVNGTAAATEQAVENSAISPLIPAHRIKLLSALALLGTVTVVASLWVYKWRQVPPTPSQRTLTRITFDEGLQNEPTWSPDGRYIAYSSDHGGKFDIWMQQLSGGNPIQITKGPGHHWQPDWSPDGKYVAYRSEDGEGGLYIAPALGGQGLERKISSFGYFPRWSPESSQLLFLTGLSSVGSCVYVVRLDGGPPRPVRIDMPSESWAISAAWHPDGKRISIWASMEAPSPSMPVFLTTSVDGGPSIRTEVNPEVLKAAPDVAVSAFYGWDPDYKFSWAPSGTAIYFERTLRGARNIWRIKVDPQTLQPTSIERLTTGTDSNSDLSLSPDGRKVAFASEFRKVQAWMFPFDAKRGRVTGSGKAVTSPGMEAWQSNLSPDGGRLAVQAIRAGRWELWEKYLPDGPETPIGMDDSYVRVDPQWSPDGTRLGYERIKLSEGEAVIWSKDRGEEPITAPHYFMDIFDWSRDGNRYWCQYPTRKAAKWKSGRCRRLETMLKQRRASSSPATHQPTCGRVDTRQTDAGLCLRWKKKNRTCINRPST